MMSPWIIFIGSVLLALSVVVRLIAWEIGYTLTVRRKVTGIAVIAVGFLGVFVCLIGSTVAGMDEVVIRYAEDGTPKEAFSGLRWCWDFKCAKVATKTQVDGTVQPITDNPKVRHLKYKLDVEIVDPILFARAAKLKPGLRCPTETGRWCWLSDAALYEIYEFNNANSKELAKYYNPYDKNQTGELQKLMFDKLEQPLAAKGIRLVRLASWSIE